jgi:hypothetical protein
MSQLANRTNDPADKSFDIQDIFNQLSGGKTSGFNVQNLLNRFGAGNLDKDGDGDVDLKDLKAMFTGDGASGFLDTAKGFLISRGKGRREKEKEERGREGRIHSVLKLFTGLASDARMA